MIPVNLHVKGVTVLKDVTVDFEKIPGDLVAITGANGQGKTSLMESVFLSLYRMFPSRPAGVYAYCHGKDAMVEFTFDWQDSRYQSKINIDAVTKTMESFLSEVHRTPGTKSEIAIIPCKGITGKSKDFDAAVNKLFGDSAMVLASSFAAQNKRGNFLDLEKIERKRLFLSMLNLEQLNAISRAAGMEVGELDFKLASRRTSIAQIQTTVAQLLPDIAAMRYRAANLSQFLIDNKVEIDRLREDYASFKAHAGRLNEVTTRIGAIRTKLDQAIQNRVGLQRRYNESKKILDQADTIRNAETTITDLRAELERRQRQVSQLAGQLRELSTEKGRYDSQVATMRQDWLRAQAAMKAAEKSKTQAEQGAALIDEVPCKAEGEFAKCQFLLRAVAEKENIDAYEVETINQKQAMLKIQDDQKALIKPNEAMIANIDNQIRTIESTMQSIRAQMDSFRSLAEKSSSLSEAEARVSELTNQIQAVEEQMIGLNSQLLDEENKLIALKDAEVKAGAAKRALDSAEAGSLCAQRQLMTTTEEIAKAELLEKQIDEAKAKLTLAMADLEKMETDRRQWSLLEKAFGPTGIQSLEIDAAGPSVSAYANELLYSCFGPRFSLKLITQKLLADGSGFRDEFDAWVIDSERGREGSISDLSGGEKVIATEALSLAVAIFNKNKSGIAWESLWRDEVTGALDDENAPRYIKMLRRAREVGHFKKVYFIAHQPRVQDLSDARINLASGTISLLT